MSGELKYVDGKWVPVAGDRPVLKLVGGEWQPDEPVDFDFMTMVKNIPGSAKNLVTDTVGGLAALPEAAATLYGQSKVGNFEPAKAVGKGMVDYYADRYGGLDEIKTTAMEDPVGMALDVVPTAGGAVKGLAKTGKVADKLARSSYERLSKFGTTIDPKDRAKMIDTGLREGLYPTAAGAKKAEQLIDTLNDAIDAQIAQAFDAGTVIPADAVLVHLKNLRREVGGMKLEGGKDLAKIDQVEEIFRDHLKKLGRDFFTPEELQAFKKDIYQKVNWKARRGKGSQAKETASKAVARAAREELEKVAPGIGPLNARLGDLYELQPNLERAAGRLGNRNYLSLTGTLGGAAAGGTSMGLPGGAMGALLGSLIMSPMAQRGATRGLYGVGNALKGVPDPNWVGPAAGAYAFTMPGRIDDDEDE